MNLDALAWLANGSPHKPLCVAVDGLIIEITFDDVTGEPNDFSVYADDDEREPNVFLGYDPDEKLDLARKIRDAAELAQPIYAAHGWKWGTIFADDDHVPSVDEIADRIKELYDAALESPFGNSSSGRLNVEVDPDDGEVNVYVQLGTLRPADQPSATVCDCLDPQDCHGAPDCVEHRDWDVTTSDGFLGSLDYGASIADGLRFPTSDGFPDYPINLGCATFGCPFDNPCTSGCYRQMRFGAGDFTTEPSF